MQGWQTPYLGLRDLPRELSEFELQAFFSFPKMRFKVTNWAEYEAGLRRRGSLTFWITESAIDAWSAAPRTTPGGQASYSDSATQICLMLRTAFKLALRAGPRIDTKMARNPSRGEGSPLKECIHLWLCRNSSARTSDRGRGRVSERQGVELLSGGRGLPIRAIELPLADHVHGLDSRHDAGCGPKRFEAHHGPHDPLDRSVVLLDDVVQILDSPQFDVGTGVGLNALDGGRVGAALVDGDLLRHAVQIDGTLEESTRGCAIALGRQQEVDGLSRAIDSAVQVLPVAAHKNVGVSRPRGFHPKP